MKFGEIREKNIYYKVKILFLFYNLKKLELFFFILFKILEIKIIK